MFTNDDCDDDDANNSDDYVDETQGLNMNRSLSRTSIRSKKRANNPQSPDTRRSVSVDTCPSLRDDVTCRLEVCILNLSARHAFVLFVLRRLYGGIFKHSASSGS